MAWLLFFFLNVLNALMSTSSSSCNYSPPLIVSPSPRSNCQSGICIKVAGGQAGNLS
ncbi:hypothetical protein ACP4OV_014723 [Aristida adscensionis]